MDIDEARQLGLDTSSEEEEVEPTLTVAGWFGKDKDVTRDEYIKLWVEHSDLYRLVHYKQLAYMEAWVQDIKDEIAEIAGLSWDLAYNVQEEDKNGKSKS